MKIKVPFKTWKVITEREVDFLFRIGTLEDACDVLKCDLWDIQNQNANDVNIAILYAGYQTACEKLGKRKKYGFEHAVFWSEHMSKESQGIFLKAVQELLGKMNKGTEEKKK